MALTTYVIPGKPARPKEYQDNPVGYEQKVISNSSVGLTSIPPDANKVMIIVEETSIRWREDGTDPTSSVGTKAFAGTKIHLEGRGRISAFRAIRTSTTKDSKLSASYYNRK